MTRHIIIVFGILHALIMLGTTIWASLTLSILNTGHLFQDVWFIATLTDTYLAFIIIYLWLALTTSCHLKKALYFILIMGLGNIAIGLIISYKAIKATDTTPISDILLGDLNHR